MKKSFIFLTAALISGFTAAAQDYNWDKPDKLCERIECIISGRDQPMVAFVPILVGDKKPVNCSVSNWDCTLENKEEMKAFSLYVVTPPLKENEWITSTFTFKIRSRREGRMRFELRAQGNWAHTGKELPDAVFMGVARISSPQISFPRGGYFGNPDLGPWCFDKDKVKDKRLLPTIMTDDSLSTPGKKYIRTRQRLVQYIDVKPGQEFTITFTVKPMEYYVALH